MNNKEQKNKNPRKPKNTKKTLGRLLGYLGQYKAVLVIVLFLIVINSAANIAGVFLVVVPITSIIRTLYYQFVFVHYAAFIWFKLLLSNETILSWIRVCLLYVPLHCRIFPVGKSNSINSAISPWWVASRMREDVFLK